MINSYDIASIAIDAANENGIKLNSYGEIKAKRICDHVDKFVIEQEFERVNFDVTDALEFVVSFYSDYNEFEDGTSSEFFRLISIAKYFRLEKNINDQMAIEIYFDGMFVKE